MLPLDVTVGEGTVSYHWNNFPAAGVAGGATRAALTQHFALNNNAADVQAKASLGYLCRMFLRNLGVKNIIILGL